MSYQISASATEAVEGSELHLQHNIFSGRQMQFHNQLTLTRDQNTALRGALTPSFCNPGTTLTLLPDPFDYSKAMDCEVPNFLMNSPRAATAFSVNLHTLEKRNGWEGQDSLSEKNLQNKTKKTSHKLGIKFKTELHTMLYLFMG